MRKIEFHLFILLMVVAVQPAIADERYFCTRDQEDIVVSVIYKKQGTKTHCEVQCIDKGSTKSIWQSENNAASCTAKADEFVGQHIGWGWHCEGYRDNHPSDVRLDEQRPTFKDVLNYKFRASFIQALAVIKPIEIHVAMYASEHGRFPRHLGELGFSREDMRTSSYISDLKIGSQGEIVARGNGALGVMTVLKLVPRYTLGGTSIEWSCTTNAPNIENTLCGHDKNVAF